MQTCRFKILLVSRSLTAVSRKNVCFSRCLCLLGRERERESQPFSSQVTTANEKETVLICTSKSKNRFCQSKVSPFEHEKKLLLLFENVSIYWIPSSLPNRSHPPLSFPWRTKINRPFAPTATMDFPKKYGFFRKRRRHFFPCRSGKRTTCDGPPNW